MTARLLLPLALLQAAVFAQVLTPAPTSLSFTWQSGSALPAAKALSVKSGNSTAAYTVAVTPPTALWLTVTPDAGSLPATLTVRVNPTGLAVGTYAATITVTATGFGAPATVSVSMAVSAPLPTLSINTLSLSFTTPPHPPATQTLRLNTSGGPIPFTAASQGATWLSVSPSSGVVLPGVPTILTVSVDATAVTPSTNPINGKLVITGTGVPSANKTQNVTVALQANAPTPTISSLWPSAALINTGPLTVTLRGTGFYKTITTVSVTGSPTPLKITYVSPSILLADLPATLLETAGDLDIVVTNPAPGGDSTPSTFTVSDTPVVQAVVNAASYATGAVAPGELVTLFGHGIGPVDSYPMSISNDYASLILANVSVAIGSRNAAIVFVSRDQITVQVPYDVPIGDDIAVVVNNNGTIANGTVDTQAASPGLFTLDGSGGGQAAALTFYTASGTYALNGASGPARAGDVIILYLTGEGDYATSINPRTGYVVPASLTPLPQLNPLPTVTIGGAAATVQYAGPTVGGLLGVMQINAVVPDAATKGNAVPVTVDIGGSATQAGVTLVVK